MLYFTEIRNERAANQSIDFLAALRFSCDIAHEDTHHISRLRQCVAQNQMTVDFCVTKSGKMLSSHPHVRRAESHSSRRCGPGSGPGLPSPPPARGTTQYTVAVLEKLSEMTYADERWDEAASAYRRLYDAAPTKTGREEAMKGYVRATVAGGDGAKIAAMAADVCGHDDAGAAALREAKYAWAGQLRAEGRRDEAVKLYRELAKDVRTKEGSEAAYYVIESTFGSGDMDKTEKEVFAFSEREPQAYWLAKAFILLGDVYVEKGGEIIPKIVGVDRAKRREGAAAVEFITYCPECGTKLIRIEGEANHYCPNEDHCPPQIAGKIEHFVSRKAMNIEGMGEETIELLLGKRLIRDVADIYGLPAKREELIGLEKIVYPESFEMTSIPLAKVIYGFEIGIKNISSRNAETLAGHFGSLEAYAAASKQELSAVIGDETTVNRILDYFRTPFNQTVERLKEAGAVENIPLDYVVYALNIPGINWHKADLLAARFDYIYELSVASAAEIRAVEGIDADEADSIVRFFRSNEKLVRKLNTLSVYRMQEKSVDNLIAGIEKSKTAGFPALLNALGIRYIGETASRNLAKSFRELTRLMEADFEQLTEVEDIGEQMANSILRYFGKEENRQLVKRLIDYGVEAEIGETETGNDSLTGQTFVITGTLTRPREYFKELILNAGGKVSDSVSAKTAYLLAGENAGSKLKKAEKLGTRIISEEEFYELLK